VATSAYSDLKAAWHLDKIDEAWIMESNCIVAQAWKMAMGVK